MYDERTGATHMLGAGATAVWSALASAGGASSVEALALALASGEDDRDEPVATEVVSSVLADLARLGVLEAVKP